MTGTVPVAWPTGNGEMADRIRSHDWTGTTLGPPAGWPAHLRCAVEMMLAVPTTASVAVGPERLLLYNDAAAALYGRNHPAALGRPLAETFAHEFELVAPFYDRVFAGEGLHVPAQPLEPGGEGVAELFDAWLTPVRDEAGTVIAAHMMGIAVSERARLEIARRDAEERLRAMMHGIPQLVWRAADGGHCTWTGPQWTVLTGLPERDSLGLGWLAAVHPDDREATRALWADALARGEFAAEYRIRSAREDRYRWFQSRATLVRDDEGRLVEWLGTSTDIDDLRRLKDRQQSLLSELQHRVRNILAAVRSVVRRSWAAERDSEDYVRHLDGRLSALSRTQVLLTRGLGRGLELEDLIRDEFIVQAASDRQFTLDGPQVQLAPRAAEVMTLAIHELATNANKYGAFTRETGRLEVSWQCEARDGQKWVALRWRERGIPILDAAPREEGFGTELITLRLPYELRGTGSLRFLPGGLECLIEFPLQPGRSVLQSDEAVS